MHLAHIFPSTTQVSKVGVVVYYIRVQNKTKFMAHNYFHGNGLNCISLIKKETIRMLEFAAGLPYDMLL